MVFRLNSLSMHDVAIAVVISEINDNIAGRRATTNSILFLATICIENCCTEPIKIKMSKSSKILILKIKKNIVPPIAICYISSI